MIGNVDAQGMKDIIDEVRAQIGRIIIFHVPNTHAPLDGFYNPVTDTRYQMTVTDYEVLARVHWTNDEAITATSGGKYFQGEAYAVIDPSYLSIAEGAQQEGGSVTVDSHEMAVSKIIPVGAPIINRYRLILVGTGQRPT